jgi:hypothetical protein
METYPIAIVQDRYTGVYSGGLWLAIACATDIVDGGQTRVDFCFTSDDGPYGSDMEAGSFWVAPPSWIAVGSTPEEALANLRNSQT